VKILFLNYMNASLATMVRSFELARATSALGHDVVLSYMHPRFRPPAGFGARLAAAGTDRLTIRRPESAGAPAGTSAPVRPAAPGTVTEARPTALGLARQAVASLRWVPGERALLREVRPDVVVARPDQVLSFVVSTRLAGVPLVLDTDGPVEELDHYWGIRSRWFRGCDTWRARRAAALLHISRVCGDLWRAKGIAPDRLFLCPNGADPLAFRPGTQQERQRTRQALGLAGCRVIGFSGNQRTWHGVGNLMQAAVTLFRADAGLRLLVVGAIEDRGALRLDDLPADDVARRVVFTGPVPYADMPRLLDAADILAMPYPPLELFHFSPMKMFEALAMGKILVAPRQGQIGEILGPVDSACLYDAHDAGGLGEALRLALARPPGSGRDGRALLTQAHSWARRGAVVVEACERALRARGGAPT